MRIHDWSDPHDSFEGSRYSNAERKKRRTVEQSGTTFACKWMHEIPVHCLRIQRDFVTREFARDLPL